MKKDIIQLDKDDLRELLFEYTKSSGEITSDLMGSTQKTLNEHSISLAETNLILREIRETQLKDSDKIKSVEERVSSIEKREEFNLGEKKGKAVILAGASAVFGGGFVVLIEKGLEHFIK